MIAEAALDERARQLGLNISDKDVAKRITEDPAFRGLNGQFDENRFQQLIRQAGFSEQRFVSEQRRQTLRHQLATAIGGEFTPPKTAAEMLDRLPERGAQHRLRRARRQPSSPTSRCRRRSS